MPRKYLASFAVFVFLLAPQLAFSAPVDFNIRAISTRVEPWTKAQVVVIDSTGNGVFTEEYTYHDSGEPPAPTENIFNLSTPDLDSIWNTVVANNFFALSAELGDVSAIGGYYVELTIWGNGSEHTVTVGHGASPEIDAIINSINAVTPVGYDLIFLMNTKPSGPGLGSHSHGHPHSHSHPHPHAQKPAPEKKYKDSSQFRDHPKLGPAEGLLGLAATANPPKFPGSSVSYCCSLQAGVESGKVQITALGSAYGNTMKMTVDNSGAQAVKDTLKLTLNLEFWGAEADSAKAAQVVAGITALWGNKTTTGPPAKPVKLCINALLDTAAVANPNTPGYHQIELDSSVISHVHGMGTAFDRNRGTGEGTWEGMPPASEPGLIMNNVWAHEVGHLLGLPDRYKDYRRQANGNWRLRSGGPEFTPAALADSMQAQFGGNLANWQARLSNRANRRFTPVCPGVPATDLMAAIGAGVSVQQADIDSIAVCPMLKIQVAAGDVLVNEDPTEQDFVVTKSCDFMTPKDSTFCWETIQATCIDPELDLPTVGRKMEVTTNICDWEGFKSAINLKKLLAVIEEKEASGSIGALNAIWWLVSGEPLVGVNPLLQCAGLSSAERQNDWPDPLSPTGSSHADSSEVVYPLELIKLVIQPWWAYQPLPPAPWEYAAWWIYPLPWPNPPVLQPLFYDWYFNYLPLASSAFLDPTDDVFSLLYPDVCGSYRFEVFSQVQILGPYPGFLDGYALGTHFVYPQPVITFEDPGAVPAMVMNPPGSWTVTSSSGFSGLHSLASGIAYPYDPIQEFSIFVDLTSATQGEVKFNVRTSLDPAQAFVFLVDEVPYFQTNGTSSWQPVEATLPLGGTYELTWLVDALVPSTAPPEVFIDDLMLPGQLVTSDIPIDDPRFLQPVSLLQNAPNPVVNSTNIAFALAEAGPVTLRVFDAQGRLVQTVLDEVRQAGEQAVTFNAQGLASGMYFYRLEALGAAEARKMIVIGGR